MTALAVLVALVGAMFVAMVPSASAQSMMYFCTNVAAEGDTADLRVTNEAGTVGYQLDTEGADAGETTTVTKDKIASSTSADAADMCDTVSSTAAKAGDQAENTELARDGDALTISKHDVETESDDRAKWQRVYQQVLQDKDGDPKEASSLVTNVLLLDNLDNPKKGADLPDTDPNADDDDKDNDVRAQSLVIPGPVGDYNDSEAGGDKFDTDDESESIVAVTGTGTAADGWTITAVGAGTAEITVTDKRTGRSSLVKVYKFEVRDKLDDEDKDEPETIDPTLEIKFLADSDATFGAGGSVRVRVVATDVSVNRIEVNGGLDFYVLTTTTMYESSDADPPVVTMVKSTAAKPNPKLERMVVGSTVFGTDAIMVATDGAYTMRDDDKTTHDGDKADDDIDGSGNPNGPKGANEPNQTIAKELNVALPAGTTAGEYQVTVYGTYERAGTNRISATKAITVGKAGSNVSEAVLVPSPLDADGDPVAEGSSQKTQPESAAAKGDPIRLTLTALNELGNAANTPINVNVTAVGATIKHSHSVNAKGAYAAVASGQQGQNNLRLDGLTAASIVVEISKETPGEVEVSALIVDPNGNGYDGSDKVMLTFTGPAKTVSLTDATTTLLNQYKHHSDDPTEDTDPRDSIALKLTAADADGNAVVPTKSASVTVSGPGPDGLIVPTDGTGKKIDVSQVRKGTTTTITLRVVSSVTAANPLKSGEYTVTVKDVTRKATAKFTVVGLTDQVEIVASEADENGQIDVTVKVSADEDGTPVADGTVVTIDTADLRGDSDRVILRTSAKEVKTKAGEAKATFIEVGPGRAAIIATADGKTDVHRVTSTFDAPVVVEEEPEVASLACLSETNGFSAWTCEVEASASEIFDWVKSRGATAIHLNSGGKWIRYSVVDGTMVPGSSNFTVTEDDILYISN